LINWSYWVTDNWCRVIIDCPHHLDQHHAASKGLVSISWYVSLVHIVEGWFYCCVKENLIFFCPSYENFRVECNSIDNWLHTLIYLPLHIEVAHSPNQHQETHHCQSLIHTHYHHQHKWEHYTTKHNMIQV